MNKSKSWQSFCYHRTSHLSDFEQVEKLISYFTDFERVRQSCFLDILLNSSYPCLSVKIFSWAVFIHNAIVTLVFLKRFLVTDQLELEKTKIHSQFLILRLHCWCNKNIQSIFNIALTLLV